jgi:AcrR family transcriptional regulator
MTGDADDLRALFARLKPARAGEAPPSPRTPAQEKLVRAALEIFAAEGYAAATTRAIAARAGVAEKTLFHAFGSKAGLFNEAVTPLLLETIGPSVFARLRSVIQATSGDLRTRLRAIFQDRLALAAGEPLLLKFLLQELLLRPGFRAPFIAHWKAHILPPIRGVIAAAVERRELRALPPGRVLRMVISLLVGYLVARHILLPDLDWDDEAELDGMLEALFEGIAGDKPAHRRR